MGIVLAAAQTVDQSWKLPTAGLLMAAVGVVLLIIGALYKEGKKFGAVIAFVGILLISAGAAITQNF